MGKARHSDDLLIKGILEGDARERTKALEAVYHQYFPAVRSYVLKNNGSLEEARDTFQEGVVAFYQNLKTGKFKQESSISSYLYAICRNVWLMRLRKMGSYVMVDEGRSMANEDSEVVIDYQKVDQIIDQLNPDCKKILVAYYYKKHSMKQIKEMFGLNSEQIAKTKKYRCMKTLVALLEKKGLTIEHFIS